MKRSGSVVLSLVPAVAAWLAGCAQQTPLPTHQQVCADSANRIVDDERCREQQRRSGGGVFPLYHYYFMPYRAGGYPVGWTANGGSYSAPTDRAARVAAGRVVTGGFGSTARSAVGG